MAFLLPPKHTHIRTASRLLRAQLATAAGANAAVTKLDVDDDELLLHDSAASGRQQHYDDDEQPTADDSPGREFGTTSQPFASPTRILRVASSSPATGHPVRRKQGDAQPVNLRQRTTCRRGHPLRIVRAANEVWYCSVCRGSISRGARVATCVKCRLDLCSRCTTRSEHPSSSPLLRGRVAHVEALSASTQDATDGADGEDGDGEDGDGEDGEKRMRLVYRYPPIEDRRRVWREQKGAVERRIRDTIHPPLLVHEPSTLNAKQRAWTDGAREWDSRPRMRKHYAGTPKSCFKTADEREARRLKLPPPGDLKARQAALSEKVEFMRVVADNALYNRQVKRDELFEDFLENVERTKEERQYAAFMEAQKRAAGNAFGGK